MDHQEEPASRGLAGKKDHGLRGFHGFPKLVLIRSAGRRWQTIVAGSAPLGQGHQVIDSPRFRDDLGLAKLLLERPVHDRHGPRLVAIDMSPRWG